jgi:hypothetical protein
MINNVSKRCEYPSCTVLASYGLNRKKTHCVKHKTLEMSDTNKRCIYKDCITRPSFGINGKKTHCAKHREEKMISVNQKCEYKKCMVQPCYGNDGKYTHCFKHKTTEMIDNKNKKCAYSLCTSQAPFGPLFQPKTHCFKHASKNMFFKNKPKCPCGEPAYYGNINYPVHCENCKLDHEKNLVESKCASCGLEYLLTEDLCSDCGDFYKKSIRGAKENAVGDYLKGFDYKILSHDKVPDNACSKYRPDFVLDFDTYICIVEVDENQHITYPCECEQIRMIQLFQDFGGIPVVFIRYNPDKYINSLGDKITSMSGRLGKLSETIEALKYTEHKALSVIYLYYDKDSRQNREQISIDF